MAEESPKAAEENLFTKSIDQTRLDKLRGEILASVSELEQEGYRNAEVANALVWAAMFRMRHEDPGPYKNFMLHLQKMATDSMDEESAFVRSMAKLDAKNKIN